MPLFEVAILNVVKNKDNKVTSEELILEPKWFIALTAQGAAIQAALYADKQPIAFNPETAEILVRAFK